MAVAHLEGIDKGRGLSRDLWHACEIQGRILGRFIDFWRAGIERNSHLKPDVVLAHALLAQLRPISSADEWKYERRVQFEALVKKAFIELNDVTDITERVRKLLKIETNIAFQPDLAIVLDEHQILIEITRSDIPDEKLAPREKAAQLLQYLDSVGSEIGILVVGGQYFDTLRQSGEKRLLILDSQRLARFCGLAKPSRLQALRCWIDAARCGEQYCWFAGCS